jgi:hypothetical protein
LQTKTKRAEKQNLDFLDHKQAYFNQTHLEQTQQITCVADASTAWTDDRNRVQDGQTNVGIQTERQLPSPSTSNQLFSHAIGFFHEMRLWMRKSIALKDVTEAHTSSF